MSDLKLLKSIFMTPEKQLLDILYKKLQKSYGKKSVVRTKDFLVAKGSIPVALVAHVDTVFTSPPKEEEIFYDSEKNVMWSEVGLGADDRAGVFSILKIIERGYRPHIIFTTAEEKGGIGASLLTSRFPDPFTEIKYLIELDRRGIDDCVFYDSMNIDFIEYVESFGFKEQRGLFSDISIICPAWDRAGVNLSIGYRNEHSYIETLHLNHMYATIEKVIHMLEDADSINIFKYEGYFQTEMDLNDYITECSVCGKLIYSYESIPVINEEGLIETFCSACLTDEEDNLSWCISCGRPFKKNGKLSCDKCGIMNDYWEVVE